nr:MAG TPA: hypothetical protein [Caudoviricetes sp.]
MKVSLLSTITVATMSSMRLWTGELSALMFLMATSARTRSWISSRHSSAKFGTTRMDSRSFAYSSNNWRLRNDRHDRLPAQ